LTARTRLRSALLGALCFILLHSAFCLSDWGQSNSVDWFTIDGGGGTSTGGQFSVSGIIGQPDNGVNKFIIIPSPAGNRFFRLKNP
jgi:hypothetical protein